MSTFGLDTGDTLAQVNVVRSAMGFPLLSELPNAHTGQPAACLFYRALADCGAKGVNGSSVRWSSERQAQLVADLWGTRANGSEVHSPSQMTRTVARFDSHKMPYYEE